jgi:hypothetical protein
MAIFFQNHLGHWEKLLRVTDNTWLIFIRHIVHSISRKDGSIGIFAG